MGKLLKHKGLIYSGLIFLTCSFGAYMLFILTLSRIQLNQTPAVYRFVKGLVWKGGYTLPRFRDFDPEKGYDVLVFGSSTANRGIDPQIFAANGISVYNLGTDDQTPLNTEVLVRHYVPLARPRLVILDVYDRVFCQSPYESAADFIQNGNSDAAAMKMAWKLNDVRSLNMLSVRMATRNLPPVLPAHDTLYNGYRALSSHIKDFTPDNYRYFTDKSQHNSFKNILKYLHEQNIKVILTVQPKPVFYLADNHKKFRKDILPVIERYDAELIELTMDDSGLKMSDYADLSHLNKYGAEKYSNALVKNIMLESLVAEN